MGIFYFIKSLFSHVENKIKHGNYTFKYDDKDAEVNICKFIKEFSSNKDIVIVGIGHYKCWWDSIGPRIGDKLLSSNVRAFIVGDSKNNITRSNFKQKYQAIKVLYPNCAILAIDALVSDKHDVGTIHLNYGGLRPAAYFTNDTFEFGDYSITVVIGDEKFVENDIRNKGPYNDVFPDMVTTVICNGIKLALSNDLTANKEINKE